MRIDSKRLMRMGTLLCASVVGFASLSACSVLNSYPPAPAKAETPDHRYKIGPLDTLNIV